MEELFIYFLKSSALIAAFFLSYHFLLRKETFFTSNRWFLLMGLVTSVLLPLFFIRKIIFIPQPKVTVDEVLIASTPALTASEASPGILATIDWVQLIAIGYGIVVLILMLKVLFNVLSLFKLLHNKKVEKQESFAFVDLEENIAPFSFFNFIVFNSSLYTQNEMESILLHEKVHSQQKHSIDVLVAKLFSVLFWFNPFMWLYKKAIIQNLEYIADNKAVQLIEDKRVYQKALLKVVTHQNCLSITSHFYQSLIKKRIVMLNKNQSHKRNSWKYTVVIPALILFIVFFQVKIIAQEIAGNTVETTTKSDAVYVTITKKTTDAEMKRNTDWLKEQYGIKLKCSKIKRNANGEIVGIKVEFDDKKGNSGVQQFSGNEPIKPIHFYKKDNKIGFGKTGESKVYAYSSNGNPKKAVVATPESPEAAETPEAPEALDALEIIGNIDAPLDELEPIAPISGLGSNSRVYIQRDNEKPIVIVDGKVLKGGEKLSKKELKALKNSGNGYVYSYSSGNNNRAISDEDVIRIKTDAMNNARISMRKMAPEIRAQVRKEMDEARAELKKIRPEMEKARMEMERARPNMDKARAEMDRSRPEIEKARAEMMQAREEMLKARAEMEQAKAELDKARAESKEKK